jgi:hypothetical protein
MGGTDGPLARVDPDTGRVFATVRIVGNRPLTDRPFILKDKTGYQVKINRTLVLMSADDGTTWQRVGLLAYNAWRLDVVPRKNNRLAFAHYGFNISTNIGHAFVNTDYLVGFIPQYAYYPAVTPQQEGYGPNGWNQSLCDHLILYTGGNCLTNSNDFIKMNLMDGAVLTRSPNSQNLLIAYMDTLDNAMGDGFRLYVYDEQSSWTELPPIAPQTPDINNFVFHVTPVDAGLGPILYYWYDVNTITQEAMIRGRIVNGESNWTDDFAVSRSYFGPRSFDVMTGQRFYGDYHTAGGYVVRNGPNGDWSFHTYHYYPVWLEPDGNVRFAHVKFQRPFALSIAAAEALGYHTTSARAKTISRQLIDTSTLEMIGEEDALPPRTR